MGYSVAHPCRKLNHRSYVERLGTRFGRPLSARPLVSGEWERQMRGTTTQMTTGTINQTVRPQMCYHHLICHLESWFEDKRSAGKENYPDADRSCCGWLTLFGDKLAGRYLDVAAVFHRSDASRRF